MAKKEISYTDAMAEIETILAALREENTDVDTLTAKVKRASELIELCKAKLRKTEDEVEKLFGEQ
ncbi:MAG: exodeoxyribonuclease VII small subunit [Alistipes sp.]|nr:exodeoxyribonuclease VII small subunit [Alistipes sp.]